MWFKFCKDYIKPMQIHKTQLLLELDEQNKFLNSPANFQEQSPQDPSSMNLEAELNPERHNILENPKVINEARQPIRTKATGQGADALLNINKDLPAYGDNFVNVSGWNS